MGVLGPRSGVGSALLPVLPLLPALVPPVAFDPLVPFALELELPMTEVVLLVPLAPLVPVVLLVSGVPLIERLPVAPWPHAQVSDRSSPIAKELRRFIASAPFPLDRGWSARTS
jgi:hypothetical protein